MSDDDDETVIYG